MKALLVLREDGSTRYGGDTALFYDTVAALRELDVEIDAVESNEPDARGYDVAHVFNVGDPAVCARQVEACERAGTAIALSPVWLDLRELFSRGIAAERVLLNQRREHRAAKELERLRQADLRQLFSRRELHAMDKREAEQAAVLRRVHVLLPNSAIEARDCLLRLGVRGVPLVIVPIAANLEPHDAWQNARDGVLAVGRVETRKNQSMLAFALRDCELTIDVVGAAYNPALVELCRRWNPRMRFHGRLPRDEVLAFFGRARVHVLISWCETAGIATLEAAAAGANIVVGDRGAEVEYFGDCAEYADPADWRSVRDAVLRALERPPRVRGDELDRRIRRLAARAGAEETLRAYRIARERKRSA